MKRGLLLCLLPWLLPAALLRAQQDTVTELDRQNFLAAAKPAPKPAVDTPALLSASNSFLKEREPELSTDEYALYQKVVGLVGTNQELAVRLLEGLTKDKTSQSPAFDLVRGNLYAGAGQVDRAEASYRSAVNRYPTFLRAWNNLGLLYYNQSRFADAAGCFARSAALGDRESSTLGLLGYCLERQGDFIAAETAYRQALGADPSNRDWKEGLFRLALSSRQYGYAGRLAQSLIQSNPTDVRLWLDYAGVLIADGRKLEAMAVLEQAQIAVPLDADSLLLLGDLYAEQGLAPDAVAVYQKAFALAGNRSEQRLLQFARMLIATGRLDEAGRTLDAIPSGLSRAAQLERLQARADLELTRRRWPAARHEAEALLAITPLNGRALLVVGRSYLEENNLPQAAFAFETAARIPESAYQANVELANVDLRNRHFTGAARHLEAALKIQKTATIEAYLDRIRALISPEDTAG